ncbi:sorting and assembly machinery component 50 [Anaeramoeba flamelloides]|uniref:Sorting and assembly machinery component 50 n=1 Tax=Anaeramoeba flamelloides TaxID=1746091 RepID=A0AAV8A6S4_9EUKA|nr:sorting and assembly machinery component 50 [Anaeramoeba flamelloides]
MQNFFSSNKKDFFVQKNLKSRSKIQDQTLKKPLYVAFTEVKGREKTNKDLLVGHLNKFKEPNNLEELLVTSEEFMSYLKTLNIFQSAQIEYDAEKQYFCPKKQKSSVKILLKEHSSHPRFKTFLGLFSIGSLLSSVNLFGGGERVDLFANLGVPITDLYFGFTKPLLSKKDLTLDGIHLAAYKSDYSIKNRSENLVRKGVKLTLSTPFVRHYYHQSHFKTKNPGTHSLTYLLESREITNQTKEESFNNFDVELNSKTDNNDCGNNNQNLKASAIYRYRFDNRNSPVFPSKGILFDFSNELAALYQGGSFFKSKLKFGLHLPIFKKFSVSLKGNSGIVTSTSFPMATQNVSVFERFYPRYQKNLAETKRYLLGEKKRFAKKKSNKIKFGKSLLSSESDENNEFELQTLVEDEKNSNYSHSLTNQNYLDSYGADVHGNLTAAINLRIPFPEESNFTFGVSAFIRSQVFGLTDLSNQPFKDSVYNIIKKRKDEMGVGFSTCCGFKRFDLNWTVPLENPNKKLLKQLQFSLEMDLDYNF